MSADARIHDPKFAEWVRQGWRPGQKPPKQGTSSLPNVNGNPNLPF